ncbi:MAG: YceI family protein [Flavobacterium micromati]|nr:YceI family protein [Flavobacterium micromati]
MRKITLLLLFLITFTSKSQEKMHSTTGITYFEASIPLFEEVKAVNKKTTCTLITATGDLNCWLSVKDFEFKRNLMREHFNSIYMESNRYPKALFKGRIDNFDLKTISSTTSFYQIRGKITVKGRTKNIIIEGSLKKVNNALEFNAEFPLNTDDFRVEIPFIVRNKISKIVTTQINCVLK